MNSVSHRRLASPLDLGCRSPPDGRSSRSPRRSPRRCTGSSCGTSAMRWLAARGSVPILHPSSTIAPSSDPVVAQQHAGARSLCPRAERCRRRDILAAAILVRKKSLHRRTSGRTLVTGDALDRHFRPRGGSASIAACRRRGTRPRESRAAPSRRSVATPARCRSPITSDPAPRRPRLAPRRRLRLRARPLQAALLHVVASIHEMIRPRRRRAA